MKREVAFSVVVYDKYQYFHQVASRFMGGGGMQSNSIVFGINKLLWVMTSRSNSYVMYLFWSISHFVTQI